MNKPIFSQAAIFRLQQLASSVHKQTGVRHKLSEPNNLMALLRYSSSAPTGGIALQYQAFIRILTLSERSALVERGIPLAPASPGQAATSKRQAS